MITPQLVPLARVDEIFPRVVDYLRWALERGGLTNLTIPYLWSECSSRRAFLFVDDIEAPCNALVIRFEESRVGIVCHVLAMGGQGGHDWQETIEPIKAMAKINGAVAVLMESRRRAWQRVLKDAEEAYVAYLIKV